MTWIKRFSRFKSDFLNPSLSLKGNLIIARLSLGKIRLESISLLYGLRFFFIL
ncbi:hypothetical protein LEP1GSC116_3780 [Leptospira interrogans serovar Icterohaemorrhagiae str. Verdun HP]|uniref:Uncharacterized protein n=1 Tax=Leptospira interrogans serovar Icterohaemorrhagiae str. Verdun HP TaxID=1049910 RepID=M6R543_LEPIR|nr:hypothetical protein LEP1GSC116_3780 [Leptospira interrogans serovar Icterohaemorrhagiae str. Verdun HP]